MNKKTARMLCIGAAAAAAAPLFLIAPGAATRRQKAPFYGLNFAHRGLHSRDKAVPENSLPAFRAAAEKGYGVELDVQLSSDGAVVVFHDDTLDRVCGVHGNVVDFSLAELQRMKLLDTEEVMPLFTDVLDVLSRGAGPLIVELKSGKRNDELCEKTRELLRAYPGVYCVESFDPNIVTWFKKNAPDIVRGQLAMPEECYAAGVNRLLRRLLAGCRFSFLNRPDFIAYRIGPRPARVLRKREKDVLLIAWTSHDYATDAKENDGVIFEACTPPLKYNQL